MGRFSGIAEVATQANHLDGRGTVRTAFRDVLVLRAVGGECSPHSPRDALFGPQKDTQLSLSLSVASSRQKYKHDLPHRRIARNTPGQTTAFSPGCVSFGLRRAVTVPLQPTTQFVSLTSDPPVSSPTGGQVRRSKHGSQQAHAGADGHGLRPKLPGEPSQTGEPFFPLTGKTPAASAWR